MNDVLSAVSTLIANAYEIDVSMFDESFLTRTIGNRCVANSCPSATDYLCFLEANPREAEQLYNALYIAYSEFFRNPIAFAYLENYLLPVLMEKKRKNGEKEVRVWSAACASGQEPYSVAILADELAQRNNDGPSIRIFATDIALAELSKAQNGIFSLSSLNKVTLKRFQTYFSATDAAYSIAPKIKEYVQFSVFDLLQEQTCCPPASIYGNFDVVFCSNLLFYYNAEHRRRILEKVVHCLNPDGYLITGESEREMVKEANFRELFVNSAIFQKAY
jgi:chemotaxis methyl-accepting protein methylase